MCGIGEDHGGHLVNQTSYHFLKSVEKNSWDQINKHSWQNKQTQNMV